MVCELLSADKAAAHGCEFEFWDKEKKRMACCGKAPIANVSGHYVCLDCLPDALVRVGSGTYFGATSSVTKWPLGVQLFDKDDFLAEAKRLTELRSAAPVKA